MVTLNIQSFKLALSLRFKLEEINLYYLILNLCISYNLLISILLTKRLRLLTYHLSFNIRLAYATVVSNTNNQNTSYEYLKYN